MENPVERLYRYQAAELARAIHAGSVSCAQCGLAAEFQDGEACHEAGWRIIADEADECDECGSKLYGLSSVACRDCARGETPFDPWRLDRLPDVTDEFVSNAAGHLVKTSPCGYIGVSEAILADVRIVLEWAKRAYEAWLSGERP